MHADVRINLAVHSQLRRHFHVRVLEIGEFTFPAGVFEFDKYRAKSQRIVEWRIREGLYLPGRQFRPGLSGLLILAAAWKSGAARATTPAPIRAFLGQKLA